MASTKWVLIAAGAALLGTIAVAVIVLTSGGDSGDDPAKSLAGRARALYDQGQHEKVIALATSSDLASSAARDPAAQLVLGHSYAAVDKRLNALQAYERAVALEETHSRDPLLVEQVAKALQSDQRKVMNLALEVMRTALVGNTGKQTEGGKTNVEAHPLGVLVVATASRHKDYTTRQTALSLAESCGLAEQVDRLVSYVLDLKQGRRCKDRRRSVTKLRQLGDVRAVAALRQAAKGQGLDSRAKGNNRCLRKAAQQAIAELQAKARQDGDAGTPP